MGPDQLALGILKAVGWQVSQVWEKQTADRIQLLLLDHADTSWGGEVRLGRHG